MATNKHVELVEATLALAKYWGQPLSEIDAMTVEEFHAASDLARKQIEDEKRGASAPSGGRYRRIT